MSKVSLKITIAGRTYPLNVPESDEEKVTKAAADINKEMIQGKESGVDVLTHQTVNFDIKTAVIPAKTAYILELK